MRYVRWVNVTTYTEKVTDRHRPKQKKNEKIHREI